MNKQGELVNGKVVGGIEWTKTVLPNGTEQQGYTWNPVAGCFHACQWQMPDGAIANCYAEDVADGIAQSAYPQGFEHHYWKPNLLVEPIKLKTPAKIFVGSMADVFGYWVNNAHILSILDVAASAKQHTFQFLTKNPKRVLQFADFLSLNCWIGTSSPPDFMWNKALSVAQRERLLHTALASLTELNAAICAHGETWMSFEPLSWDVSPIVRQYPGALSWAVIGAASNGNRYYPPKEAHVRNLLDVLADRGIPVFFKGNLKSLPYAAAHWREEFPKVG